MFWLGKTFGKWRKYYNLSANPTAVLGQALSLDEVAVKEMLVALNPNEVSMFGWSRNR